MFLESGMLIAGFMDAYDSVGYTIFWLLLPMTVLFVSAVILNNRILIPQLLLKSRFSAYCIGVFGVIYVLTFISLCLEYATRRFLELPMRIADYSSPWILIDSFCNGLLLVMIFFGLGLLHLFYRWQQEMLVEERLTSKLQSYIATVKNRLTPSLIVNKLNHISSNQLADSEEIEKSIHDLSGYLREQLYELPEPPKIEVSMVEDITHSRITSMLVSKKFRCVRHLIFSGILIIISCGAFFNTPDQPEFTFDRFLGVLGLLAVLAVISYVNILWLHPRFMKHGNLKQYGVSVAILLLVIAIPLILLQILTYEPNVYTKRLPTLIAVISTVGSMLTLFLFVGGTSAALLLQNWIETKQRLTLLRAETIRQEYSYLRKQINPHFLFNVLNNIGISVYDDPDYARGLIADLAALLKYQLGNMGCQTTTLQQELSFIRSYFALEATRRDSFNYVIETDVDNENVTIPTLLFIPFVENAVKYSVSDADLPEVKLYFGVDRERLTFTCVNTCKMEGIDSGRRGGIGLDNTQRRLELLYEGNYSLQCEKREKTYSVRLEIPLN